MKQEITIEQLESLSLSAQRRLHDWFDSTYTGDDHNIHVYIPEEKDGEFEGDFEGQWGSEKEFIYPEEYVGQIKRHEGTILPLLNIGQLMQFLEDHNLFYLPAQEGNVCDWLWQRVQAKLELR